MKKRRVIVIGAGISGKEVTLAELQGDADDTVLEYCHHLPGKEGTNTQTVNSMVELQAP